MAEIYLARATGIEGFERYVVVKRILGEHAQDKRFVTMFVDEARLAAQLHHQNIAQVYDCGQDDGTYYFAMEYVHGENLRDSQEDGDSGCGRCRFEHALTISSWVAAPGSTTRTTSAARIGRRSASCTATSRRRT